MSTSPLNFKHDELTVQLPTALPPQGVTFEQDASFPPELPPLPVPPPAPPVVEIPLVPEGLFELVLQAPKPSSVTVIASAADWTFISNLSFQGRASVP